MFFQILHNTSIKLLITPQPRITGEPTVIQNCCNLVVKVKGVVQHYGRRPSLYRTVAALCLVGMRKRSLSLFVPTCNSAVSNLEGMDDENDASDSASQIVKELISDDAEAFSNEEDNFDSADQFNAKKELESN